MECLLSTMNEAEEKKEAILKKKEKGPTAMSTTKTAKDVLAEKMRLLKQFEDHTEQLEGRAEEAVAARIKQAEEKEKAIERGKERHAAAMAALDEEYAMAEKHQTRKLEAAKEDIKKVSEQYQKDLQKIDVFLASHPVMETTVPQETKKEKPPMDLETITQHLQTDGALAGQVLTPELIANSLMALVQKLGQDKAEDPVVDAHMEQKQDGEAGATKRAASPLAERPAKEQKKDGEA